jgi:arsenate reductase (thioredoxin)
VRVQNVERSKMAAALLRQMAGDECRSARQALGPSGQIDPTLVEVLDEIDVPVLAEFPKPSPTKRCGPLIT